MGGCPAWAPRPQAGFTGDVMSLSALLNLQSLGIHRGLPELANKTTGCPHTLDVLSVEQALVVYLKLTVQQVLSFAWQPRGPHVCCERWRVLCLSQRSPQHPPATCPPPAAPPASPPQQCPPPVVTATEAALLGESCSPRGQCHRRGPFSSLPGSGGVIAHSPSTPPILRPCPAAEAPLGTAFLSVGERRDAGSV